MMQKLRYGIAIDPRQPLVAVSIRPDSPNILGRCSSDPIESASQARIRSGDAAPVCPVPVLGLPIITHRPDVIGSDGSYRKKVFIDVSCIRNPTPVGSIPVIRQRIISIAIEISELGIACRPDVIGRDSGNALENRVRAVRRQWERDITPVGSIPM